jgi:hypothetical protein
MVPPLPFGTRSPVMKKGLYESLKSSLLLSLKVTVMVEATAVVAMAAASARVGAAIDPNETLDRVTAGGVVVTGAVVTGPSSPPPQPASMAPMVPAPIGSIGVTPRRRSRWRRDRSVCAFIRQLSRSGQWTAPRCGNR